jgi:hypothetical protein
MARRIHKIELFTDGDPGSWESILVAERFRSPSCRITVLDINNPAVLVRARMLGIRSLPAIVIDGRLVEVDVDTIERDFVKTLRMMDSMDSCKVELELIKEELKAAFEKGKKSDDSID